MNMIQLRNQLSALPKDRFVQLLKEEGWYEGEGCVELGKRFFQKKGEEIYFMI